MHNNGAPSSRGNRTVKTRDYAGGERIPGRGGEGGGAGNG